MVEEGDVEGPPGHFCELGGLKGGLEGCSAGAGSMHSAERRLSAR